MMREDFYHSQYGDPGSQRLVITNDGGARESFLWRLVAQYARVQVARLAHDWVRPVEVQWWSKSEQKQIQQNQIHFNAGNNHET